MGINVFLYSVRQGNKLYMQFNYYSDILMAIPEDEAFIMIDFERIKKKFCKLFEPLKEQY